MVQGTGANVQVNAGEVVYRLPAPPGYWLSSGKCEVYRAACGTSNSEEDNDCRRVREECLLLTNNTAFVNGIECPSITRRQPCDWDSNPSLLGHPIYALPFGSRNVNLPVRCRVFCEQKAGGIPRGAIIHCALHAHPLLRVPAGGVCTRRARFSSGQGSRELSLCRQMPGRKVVPTSGHR